MDKRKSKTMAQQNVRSLLLWTVVAFLGVGLLMSFLMYLYGPQWMVGAWMWMMPLGMVSMALLVVLVVLLVIGAVQSQQRPETEDPLRALEVRYARGEVSRDEFLRMRDDLVKK